MNLSENIKLVLKGKPVFFSYLINLPEREFKDRIIERMVSDDDLNSFSLPDERFVGYFAGDYGRELKMKIKSSILRRNTLSNTIWMNCKLIPTNDQKVRFDILFERTLFAKLGNYVFFGTLILILLFLVFNFNDITSFASITLLLLVFSFIYVAIITSNVKNMIMYFKKHFFEDYKQSEYEIF